jgi:hypothetical protein
MENNVEMTILQMVQDDNPKTVEHLTAVLGKKLHLPKNTIMNFVLQLQQEGKITFQEDSTVPQRINAYLQTKASLWYWATVYLTLLSVIVVFSLPGYIRYVVGSVFVLGLPGYSLVRALFPRKSTESDKTHNLDGLTTFSFTITLSIAVISVVGLVLNYTPLGVRLSTVVFILSSLSIFFATVALVRENRK